MSFCPGFHRGPDRKEAASSVHCGQRAVLGTLRLRAPGLCRREGAALGKTRKCLQRKPVSAHSRHSSLAPSGFTVDTAPETQEPPASPPQLGHGPQINPSGDDHSSTYLRAQVPPERHFRAHPLLWQKWGQIRDSLKLTYSCQGLGLIFSTTQARPRGQVAGPSSPLDNKLG